MTLFHRCNVNFVHLAVPIINDGVHVPIQVLFMVPDLSQSNGSGIWSIQTQIHQLSPLQ